MIVPDYLHELEGWRVWRIVEHPEGHRLHSVHFDAVWQPETPIEATCQHRRRTFRHPLLGRIPGHDAPGLECRCGIHALPSARRAVAYLGTCDVHVGIAPLYAIGPVALWGSVAEHTDGWRARFAYPRAIHLRPDRRRAPERLRAIAADLTQYGVPVGVLQPRTAAGAGEAWRAPVSSWSRFPAAGR